MHRASNSTKLQTLLDRLLIQGRMAHWHIPIDLLGRFEEAPHAVALCSVPVSTCIPKQPWCAQAANVASEEEEDYRLLTSQCEEEEDYSQGRDLSERSKVMTGAVAL